MAKSNGDENGTKHDGDTPIARGLLDLLGPNGDDGARARAIANTIRKDWPILAECLGGIAAKGGQEEILGGTVNIFIHEGKAKFNVNVKSKKITFFGEIKDLKNVFESIEFAMLTGQVSSKGYTERDYSSTKVAETEIPY